MSKPKKTSAPAPKAEDLTFCELPGGHRALWRTPDELTPRQTRELAIYDAVIMPRMAQLVAAKQILGADGEPLEESTDTSGFMGLPVGLTTAEARQFVEMNDVAIWAFLKDWTLRSNNGKAPLPRHPDDVLDVPGGQEVYDALAQHAAKLNALRYKLGDTDPFTDQTAAMQELEDAGEVPFAGAEGADGPFGD